MECINKLGCKDTKFVIQLLMDKQKTKNLRDKMIVEMFDKFYQNYSAESSYEFTAIKFNMSIPNIKYIVSNRCLLG